MYGDIFDCHSWCGMPQASIEWVAVTLSAHRTASTRRVILLGFRNPDVDMEGPICQQSGHGEVKDSEWTDL